MHTFSSKCRTQRLLQHWIHNNTFFRDSLQVFKSFLRKEGGKTDWLTVTPFDSFCRSNINQPCFTDRAQLNIWPDKLSWISTSSRSSIALPFTVRLRLLSFSLLINFNGSFRVSQMINLTSWTYLICITMSNVKWSCSNSSLWKAQTGLNTDILDKAYRSICIQNPLQSIHKWEQASTTLKAKVDGHYFNLAHMFGLVISVSFCWCMFIHTT